MARISGVTGKSGVVALLVAAGLCLSLSSITGRAYGQVAADTGKPMLLATNTLPITRITLYRSGVGAFQRQGAVSDNAQISLKFDASQINDVLKSLQVLDFGGRVASVSYPSKDPLARRMGSFGLQIGDNPSLPTLFERVRGSMVTLTTSDSTISGSVLSVEMREIPQGGSAGEKPAVIKTAVVNVVTASGIKAVPIPTISSFTLADKTLADELNKALTALAESRAERTKVVDVSVAGTGSRQVAMAYVHETPVWKTSYRLILPDAEGAKPDTTKEGAKEAAKGKGEVTSATQGILQGWAIVENTTDQDWANVRLSLVSGRPVSFRMDLYEPLYVFRPEVAVPTVPGVMPRAYDGGVAAVPPPAPPIGTAGGAKPGLTAAPAAKAARSEMGMRRAGGNAAPGSPGGGGADNSASGAYGEFDPGSPISAAEMVDYAARPGAKGGEVGEVFQFELENPVTIERQRSAMIPLLSSGINARRVSIYNQSDRADHPMRGVELTNTTALQLLPGPLSVMDGSAYAGDAQISQVSPGDKRLLAYAVDLDVAVVTAPISESKITKLRVVQGTFEQTVKSAFGTKYTFANKDQKRSRTIITEHPKLEGYTLRGTLKPEEQTQGLLRFATSVEAGKDATLEVVQERTEKQSIGIFNYDVETLVRFQQNGQLSDGALKAVQGLFAKQRDMSELERQIEQMDQQSTKLKADQTRITGVMQPLDRNSDTYKNFLSKLNKQEAEIDRLSTKLEETRKKAEQARADLNAAVAALSVE